MQELLSAVVLTFATVSPLAVVYVVIVVVNSKFVVVNFIRDHPCLSDAIKQSVCAIYVTKNLPKSLAVPNFMFTFAFVNPYCITLNLYAYETECDCISCKISPNAWPFRKLFVLLPLSRCDRRRSFQSSDELREDGKMGKFINPFTDMGFKRIFGQEVSKPILIEFLNSLLKGERQIKDLKFLDKEQIRTSEEDRSLIYDIY